MKEDRFSIVISAIDSINSEDPGVDTTGSKPLPEALLYGQRMSFMLEKFAPDSSELLFLAARGQHIKRWAIARSSYPADRKGYLQWRTELKIMHGEIMSGLMMGNGYSVQDSERVRDLILKKKLKQDHEVQTLEDVICLVFLQYYFDDFIAKHQDEEEKIISILQKTWKKMSTKGHEAALKLELSEKALDLVKKALGLN